MVIPPAELVMVTPLPAVYVAATGVLPVLPIITWPFVMLPDQTGTPDEFETRLALLVAAS